MTFSKLENLDHFKNHFKLQLNIGVSTFWIDTDRIVKEICQPTADLLFCDRDFESLTFKFQVNDQNDSFNVSPYKDPIPNFIESYLLEPGKEQSKLFTKKLAFRNIETKYLKYFVSSFSDQMKDYIDSIMGKKIEKAQDKKSLQFAPFIIEELTFEHCILTHELLACVHTFLQNTCNITHLTLSQVTYRSDPNLYIQIAEMIGQSCFYLPNLVSCNLSWNAFGQIAHVEFINSLLKLTSLRLLDLTGVAFTDSSFAYFAQAYLPHCKLESLNLSNNRIQSIDTA